MSRGCQLRGAAAQHLGQGIAGALLPGAPPEVGSEATSALSEPSPARADDARLPDQPLDDRPHCGIDPHPVRNPVPPRSPRTVDAPPAMESAETTRTRPGEG